MDAIATSASSSVWWELILLASSSSQNERVDPLEKVTDKKWNNVQYLFLFAAYLLHLYKLASSGPGAGDMLKSNMTCGWMVG